MGATRIMVIRHAEKPGEYDEIPNDGSTTSSTSKKISFTGIEANGCESKESLVTRGWERAGALVTLFAPPHGPLSPFLDPPQHIFAANPNPNPRLAKADSKDKQPSRRPYETITAVARQLSLTADVTFNKQHYGKMVEQALSCNGVVLIAWQHEDIFWGKMHGEGIARCIIEKTDTAHHSLNIPTDWPSDRYDLVWVFDIDSNTGQVSSFTQVPQQLLHGDKNHGISLV